MAGYGQFCPVAKAAEIFAERWTPLVLRELLAGSHRFNDLQRGVPLMSRTLLARRLRELEDTGVIQRMPKSSGRGAEYYLTAAGQELQPVIEEPRRVGSALGAAGGGVPRTTSIRASSCGTSIAASTSTASRPDAW